MACKMQTRTWYSNFSLKTIDRTVTKLVSFTTTVVISDYCALMLSYFMPLCANLHICITVNDEHNVSRCFSLLLMTFSVCNCDSEVCVNNCSLFSADISTTHVTPNTFRLSFSDPSMSNPAVSILRLRPSFSSTAFSSHSSHSVMVGTPLESDTVYYFVPIPTPFP